MRMILLDRRSSTQQEKIPSLTPAPIGIAKRTIWTYKQELPQNLLLILDVDDGDFIGACVKQEVPHVGVKLVKKGVPKSEGNQIFDIHIGFVQNDKGEYCIFFYESVSQECVMNCYPTKEEAYKAWEEIKNWLTNLIQKVLIVLAMAAIAATLAVLIVDAIMVALAVLIAI